MPLWDRRFIFMKYFLHDTSAFDDEKVSELFIKFGYEGLGLFYTILEKLGKQEKPVKTLVLKHQLKVGKKLEKCWKFMESIGIISSNNGETFNKQLLNFSEKYQIKKEKTREKVSQWRKNQEEIENVTDYVPICNAPKVNKSKVKENKVNNKELPEKNSGFPPKSPKIPIKKDVDFIDEIIQLFKISYEQEFLSDYEIVNRGKERAAAGSILKIYKQKYPNSTSLEVKDGLDAYFKMVVKINDKFYRNSMSLSMLNSQFNQINNIIKNGGSNRKCSDADIVKLAAEKFGISDGD